MNYFNCWPIRFGVHRIGFFGACYYRPGEHVFTDSLFCAYAYDSGEGKIEQTKILESFLEEEYNKGNYVIAGGDFNQSFSGTDTSMYPLQGNGLWECGLLDESQFPEGWQFLMDNSVPSCRSLDRPYDPNDETFQYYLIDGFIASPNVTAVSIETLDLGFVNSDHNPVKLTVTLNP